MLGNLIRGVNKFLKATAYDYCSIESNSEIDPNTLITKDGGYLTMFDVMGSLDIVGDDLFAERLSKALQGLQNSAVEAGHRLHWTFTRDPSYSREQVKFNIDKLRATAARLKLNVEDMLNEREDLLSQKVCYERCLLAITTSPACMPDSEVGRIFDDRSQRAIKDKTVVKAGQFGASPHFEVSGLFDSHKSFVDTVLRELRCATQVKQLSAREAVKAIRLEAAPDITSPDWKPVLLGDKINPRMMKEVDSDLDMSHVLNVPIAYQLFPSCPEQVSNDPTLVSFGTRVYAPLLVDYVAGDLQTFNDLFSKIPSHVPWRWSFQMHTGHKSILGKIKTKKSYATWLSLTNSGNKLIREAAEELIYFGEKKNEALCVGQLAITTWGATEKEARSNRAYVMKAMQSWGVEVIEERGDSVEAFMNTLPAVSERLISNQLPMLLKDALGIAPLFRPNSPWGYGNQLFRTKDKKIYPFLTGSSKQENWVSLFFAPPGKGKSFLMSSENMAHVLRPGNAIIPRLSILDIGDSSSVFVDFLKAALPEDQKHLAMSVRLQNTREYAINPFDLPLGCYRPLAVDKEYLVNLMIILLTPAGAETPPMMSEIVSLLVSAMYDHYSPEGEPYRYEQGEDEEVDKAIVAHGLHVTEDYTTWFEIRDMLFDRKDYVNATRAQRFAVPTIEDAAIVLKENHSLRTKFVGEAGQALLTTLLTMIQSAVGDYPVMSSRTRFDIGNARIASIDLQDVTPSSSSVADKQCGLMYMLGRYALCKDFFRNKDNLMEIPEKYRPYHTRILEVESQVPKKLCMDEIHRTRNCPMVRVQVLKDAREGRKHDIIISLSSQFIEDYDEAMVKAANTTYILAVNTEDVMDEVHKRYRLSRDTKRAIRSKLRGPTSEGSDFLFISNIKGSSRAEMILLLTVGPMEGWAYSTTKQDVLLKNAVIDQVGLDTALAILSKEFPGFTAVDYIQRRKEESLADDNIHKIIALELIEKYRNLKGKSA